MGTYSLEVAQEMLTEAKAAYKKALHAESYGTGGRSVSRPRLEVLSKEVDKWQRIVDRVTNRNGGIPVRGITPV